MESFFWPTRRSKIIHAISRVRTASFVSSHHSRMTHLQRLRLNRCFAFETARQQMKWLPKRFFFRRRQRCSLADCVRMRYHDWRKVVLRVSRARILKSTRNCAFSASVSSVERLSCRLFANSWWCAGFRLSGTGTGDGGGIAVTFRAPCEKITPRRQPLRSKPSS